MGDSKGRVWTRYVLQPHLPSHRLHYHRCSSVHLAIEWGGGGGSSLTETALNRQGRNMVRLANRHVTQHVIHVNRILRRK